jgi:small-conductance mechanosensitive channel
MGVFYEEQTIWLFLLVTVLIGGWMSWRTGRALAGAWKPLWLMLPAALGLGLGVRFLHFALFEGTLLSLHYWLVDSGVCGVLGWLGWRFERARSMARQYAFAFRRAAPFSFARKA